MSGWLIVFFYSVSTIFGSFNAEGVLRNPPNSNITGILLSDCLVSCSGNLLEESYLSADTQSVYSTTQADWAIFHSLVRFLFNGISTFVAYLRGNFGNKKTDEG